MERNRKRRKLHSVLAWLLVVAMLASNNMSVLASTIDEQEPKTESGSGGSPEADAPDPVDSSDDGEKTKEQAKPKEEKKNEKAKAANDTAQSTDDNEKESEPTSDQTDKSNLSRAPRGAGDAHPVKVSASYKGDPDGKAVNPQIVIDIIVAEGSYDANDIEIWIPKEYFIDRNGEGKTLKFDEIDGAPRLPLPKDSAPSDDKNYYYSFVTKDDKDYYVVKNWNALSSNTFQFQLDYQYSSPTDWGYIKSGSTMEFECLVKYKSDDGSTKEYTTDKLTQTIKTVVVCISQFSGQRIYP